ncbi:MAG: hypothetical protein RIG84_03830 [Roseovarius sp.]
MREFSKLSALLAICLAVSPAAVAEEAECLEEVRALWADGGPFDAYQRPPHRNTNTMYDAAGNVTRVFDSIIETPLRTMAGIEGTHMTLAIDNRIWTGPGSEGPWTPQPDMEGDRRAGHAEDRAQRQANTTDAACHGMVEHEGATYLSYGFTTRTDPSEATGGTWFGSTDTVYIDPETRQVMIWEMGNFVYSWAPEPNGERHVIVFEYDPAIKVNPPE